MIKYLKVITKPHRIYDTAKKPLLVTCDDLKYYVCKHNFSSSNCLFNEYIAAAFLKLWEIPIPRFAFINVEQDIIQEYAIQNGLQPIWFKKTCFGSFLLQYAKEIDKNIGNIRKEQLKKIQRDDLIKIALFDIWIANEDRKFHHANLLLNPEQKEWKIYAIDHDSCFNSNSGEDLVQITEDETILAHELFTILYKNKRIEHNIIIKELFDNFDYFVNSCFSNLDNILKLVPENWKIDLINKYDFLEANLFSNSWIEESKKTFKQFYFNFLR